MGLLSLEHGRSAYRADFALYGAAVAALSFVVVLQAPPARAGEGLVWALAGVVAWTLIEYGLHRFVLHGVQPFQRWHGEHHRRPTALIGIPTLMSGALFGMLVFGPAWLLLGAWRACGLTLGVLLGYLAHSAVHHMVHHGPAAGRWLRGRQRWHAQHHSAAGRSASFGVTSALWDRVFGSVAAPARRDLS